MALESVRSVCGLEVVNRSDVTMDRMARRCWQYMSNSFRPRHRDTVGCPWRLIMALAQLIFSASAGGGIRRSESRMGIILGCSGASVSISCRPSGVLTPAMAILGCVIVGGAYIPRRYS